MSTWSAALVPFLVAAALSWPLARLLAAALGPVAPVPDAFDRLLVRLFGPGILEDQGWARYGLVLMAGNAAMFAITTLVLACQHLLPGNPDGVAALEPSLAFHTACSFVANTNLQHYSGEQALSYTSQIFGLTWLQFVSAATGLSALAALSRLLGPEARAGNHVRDLFRSTFLVLLPLALGLSLMLVATGVPMTLEGAAQVTTVEGVAQRIARGPVAAMVAIKQLGTNGGGYFGPNSTHPLENPSLVSCLLEAVAILALPMACVWMFGLLVGRLRHAAVLFGCMALPTLALLALALHAESTPLPTLSGLAVAPGGVHLEGKELRFGLGFGPAWAVMTTITSNGSVAAMHDSLQPLSVLAALVGMWLNVLFGGVGVGMVNMFLYVVAAVFLAGLMVGRTPEYLAKKIEAREMKFTVLALLVSPLLILAGTAWFAATPLGADTVANPGARGFSEILYEFTSAGANNGSGLEGLGDDTVPWNLSTGLVMLLARYLPILLPLGIAGSLATKKQVPETVGTFRTDTVLFGILLLASIFLIGALLFLPAAVLGPIAEHLSTPLGVGRGGAQ